MQEESPHQRLRLVIASRLLSGIISQDRNRGLPDRLADIDHSLDVAEELIRRSTGRASPLTDHSLRPRPLVRTRNKITERNTPPLKELLDSRRPPTPDTPARRPTLH